MATRFPRELKPITVFMVIMVLICGYMMFCEPRDTNENGARQGSALETTGVAISARASVMAIKRVGDLKVK